MKNIKISLLVWDAIAEHGKFGETEDDVLRRVLGLEPTDSVGDDTGRRKIGAQRRRNFSKRKQRAEIERANGTKAELVVEYEEGPSQRWELPADPLNKIAIRNVVRDSLRFGEANDATQGQLNAIRKALTEAGYHLTK